MRLRSLGADVTVSHVLELILRLKQICNACPRTGASAKYDDLLRRVAPLAAAGEKALVLSQFVVEPFGVAMLARRLAPWRPWTRAESNADHPLRPVFHALRARTLLTFARSAAENVTHHVGIGGMLAGRDDVVAVAGGRPSPSKAKFLLAVNDLPLAAL